MHKTDIFDLPPGLCCSSIQFIANGFEILDFDVIRRVVDVVEDLRYVLYTYFWIRIPLFVNKTHAMQRMKRIQNRHALIIIYIIKFSSRRSESFS